LFLAPQSVAFVGIPRKSGPGALNPVDNLRNWGYEGRIQLVHPQAREVAGIRTVNDVALLEPPIDLAVISTPRETIPAIVGDCGRKGVRALIVTNQGFAEADSRGAELQQAMLEEAGKSGARVLGPNTLGVYNAFDRFTSSFMPHDRTEAPVGLVCQSGVFFVGARILTGDVGLGVDIANACDIDLTDALQWLGNDNRISVIAGHAEALSGGERFLRATAEIAGRKPIVFLKTGRSPEGARAAASHSGSMTGEDRVADAVLRKAGVIRVDETQEMFEMIRAFMRLPPMRGRATAVVTLTGAGGIILADAMETYGLKIAGMSDSSLRRIRAMSPEWMPINNPIDIWPATMKHGMRNVYRMVLEDALRDPGVNAAICVALGLRPSEAERLGVVDLIQELSVQYDKPILVWLYGPEAAEAAAALERRGRSMAVHSLERAVRILSRMASYHQWKIRNVVSNR
jgi:acetyltransferase